VADTRREARAAVAVAAQLLKPEAGHALLDRLLDDDLSIKKLAIKSVDRQAPPALLGKLKTLSETSDNVQIKAFAYERLRANPRVNEDD